MAVADAGRETLSKSFEIFIRRIALGGITFLIALASQAAAVSDKCNRNLVSNQIYWLRANQADVIPVRITHAPALQYAQGRLEYMEIRREGPVRVFTKTSDLNYVSADIREVFAPRLVPTNNSLMTDERREKIGKVLAMNSVDAIVLKKDRTVWVQLLSGRLLHFDSYPVSPSVVPVRTLSSFEVFEIDQVFGAEERSESLALTLRRPIQTYVGTIRVDEDFAGSRHTAHITTIQGPSLTLPLAQLRIDPL